MVSQSINRKGTGNRSGAGFHSVLNGHHQDGYHAYDDGQEQDNPMHRQSHLSSMSQLPGHPISISSPPATVVGPSSLYYGHDRQEVTRMLIQALFDLGYPSAADELTRASGYALEAPIVSRFKDAVLEGRWKEAERIVKDAQVQPLNAATHPTVTAPAAATESRYSNGKGTGENGASAIDQPLLLSPNASLADMLFLIRRQRYLELLEKRNLHAALLLLQRKLTPLGPGNEELHRLSKLLVCSPEVVRRKLGWRGSLVDTRRALLTHLLKRVSASSMIPERRLATLFDYVKQNQVYHCYYHNTTDPISLLTDHRCDLSTFPTCESRVLEHHRDEVWFVAFSPDGKKLVTTGHDSDIYVYHVPYFDMYRRLTGGHSQSVVHAAWSPDCTKIVTCSKDHSAVLWDLESGRTLLTATQGYEPMTACAWHPDGKHFVLSSLAITDQLVVYDTGGERLFAFPDHPQERIRDCALSPDGNYLVAITASRLVVVYDFPNRTRLYHLRLRRRPFDSSDQNGSRDSSDTGRLKPITNGVNDSINAPHCITISKDSRHMLLGLADELRLVDIVTGQTLRRYVPPPLPPAIPSDATSTRDVPLHQGRDMLRHGSAQKEKCAEPVPTSVKQGFVIRSQFGGVDEHSICSGSEDGKIHIWAKDSGVLVRTIQAHAPNCCVNAVAWNPVDPGMMASVGDDHKLKIWMPFSRC